jgi:hypothetical protein
MCGLQGKCPLSQSSNFSLSWNPKVHCSVHNIPVHTISWATWNQSTSPLCFTKIHFNITAHPDPPSPMWQFLFMLSPTCYIPLPSFYRFDYYPKIHYRVDKSPPLVYTGTTSIQIRAPHAMSLRYILIPSSHLGLGLPTDLFPSHFLLKCCMHFSSLLCLHLIFSDLITLITFGDGNKLWSLA